MGRRSKKQPARTPDETTTHARAMNPKRALPGFACAVPTHGDEPPDLPHEPERLTPWVATRIVELARRGNYLETAAAAAGQYQRAVRDWIRFGLENPKAPVFGAFARDVERALAEAESEVVGVIGDHARLDWRAAAWLAEHRWSRRWGPKVQIEIRHEIERALVVVSRHVDGETLRRILSEIERLDDGTTEGVGSDGGGGDARPPRALPADAGRDPDG